jgi:hypothetical protein
MAVNCEASRISSPFMGFGNLWIVAKALARRVLPEALNGRDCEVSASHARRADLAAKLRQRPGEAQATTVAIHSSSILTSSSSTSPGWIRFPEAVR